MKSSLLFSFTMYGPGGTSETSLTNPRPQKFSPVFMSRSFIALMLTFRLMTYFLNWFLCMWWGKVWVKFLHINFELFQCDLLKRLFSPPLIVFCLCWKRLIINTGLISELSVLCHLSAALFLCQYRAVLIAVANL